MARGRIRLAKGARIRPMGFHVVSSLRIGRGVEGFFLGMRRGIWEVWKYKGFFLVCGGGRL